MKSRFLNSFSFGKKQAEYLKKLRIIKPNLIHVQSIPKSLSNIETLKTKRYFGQYGTIKDIVLSKKLSNNYKESYSVYITYENEIEAACAVLCADSLLIFRKVIRVFFGTTRYCYYFLDNQKCPNSEKCVYLHQLVMDDDLIINDNNNFSYRDQLDMSKKIIEQSSLCIKNLLSQPKNWKSRLPYLDFIFLSEEEKQFYCSKNNIVYVRNFNEEDINILIYNNSNNINIYKQKNVKFKINNNIIKKNEFNQLDNIKYNNFKNLEQNNNVNKKKYQNPFELYDIFNDSIKHILLSKPFFDNIKNIPLKKIEYSYFKKDLSKKGVDINIILEGCLDCIKENI